MAFSEQQRKAALLRVADLSQQIAALDSAVSMGNQHTALWKRRAALLLLLSADEDERAVHSQN